MSDKPLQDDKPDNLLIENLPLPDVSEVIDLPDPLVEPEPTEIDLRIAEEMDRLADHFGEAFAENFFRRRSIFDSVRWPLADINSPDYAHTAQLPTQERFELNADVLDRLIAVNRFEPYRDNNVLAFALRGTRLAGAEEAENVDGLEVIDFRPDHVHFNCLIGFYFLESRKITAFTGSTVPCRKAVYYYMNGGDNCNLLPNGLYTYYIWRHKNLTPALRLSKSNANTQALESGQWATVLRTQNDNIFGTRDIWDPSQPYDNVHCSYYTNYNDALGSYFSSWGCLTVRGRKESTHQWKKFQAVLAELGATSRIDLMLLTGKDAALASLQLRDDSGIAADDLIRLRVGSQGDEVAALQVRLGLSGTGYFGYLTRQKLTDFQRELTSGGGGEPSADGIYSPALDAQTGWGILSARDAAGPRMRIALESHHQADTLLRQVLPGAFADAEELPIRAAERRSAEPISFSLEPADEPQSTGIEFHATERQTGEKFFVAKSTKYGSRKGLARSSTLSLFDRFTAEQDIGIWAHFMWPTVMGESKGRHITINSYDRAHFTWGFYQLAAHTAKDNLILLMRELLKLTSAAIYFPDLKLVNNRVHQVTDAGEVDLEHEQSVPVGTWTEIQIPRFMKYLNPSSSRVDNTEVVNAAKFMHWTLSDPDVIKKTVDVSVNILKKKARSYATRYQLFGRRPELAIWICDMFHQGRGSPAQVKAALQLSSFSEQLKALSRIDTTGQHQTRIDTVKECVDTLLDEQKFKNVLFGEGELDLNSEV